MASHPSMRHRALRGSISLLAVVLLAGCGASGDATGPGQTQRPGAPAVIALTTAGSAGGPFGATLRSPFVATVTDSAGRPVPGATVTFSVDSGAVLSASVVTDSLGVAATRVRLPVTLGNVTLTAAVATLQASKTLSVTGVTFAHLALAQESACGISAEGYGYCWGRPNGAIAIPGDSINVPTPLIGANVLQSISVGWNGGCGIAADSTGVCWGDASGTSPARYVSPTPVPGNLKFRSLARGDEASCGVSIDGVVYCWGLNLAGELGASAVPVNSYTPTPAQVDLTGTFLSVQISTAHMCALSTAGQAYCWGRNVPPAPVATQLRFTSLALGTASTCGIATDGASYCWGANESGELGTGDTVSSVTPRKVNATATFSQLSGGGRQFCGLTAAGDVYCWGALATAVGIPYGSCPVAAWDCTTTPAQAATQGLHFTSIVSREGELCGFTNGVAYCWGFNWAGQLGTGVHWNYSPDPAPIVPHP